jgi:hypothetical protein
MCLGNPGTERYLFRFKALGNPEGVHRRIPIRAEQQQLTDVGERYHRPNPNFCIAQTMTTNYQSFWWTPARVRVSPDHQYCCFDTPANWSQSKIGVLE